MPPRHAKKRAPARRETQVEDAVRAVAAKNNRPDPLLTGTRPLKMRYKPDKVRPPRPAGPALPRGSPCAHPMCGQGSQHVDRSNGPFSVKPLSVASLCYLSKRGNKLGVSGTPWHEDAVSLLVVTTLRK